MILNNLDFTVITPVYNGADFIEETAQSVLDSICGFQAEYIVINDGSTDATLAKLEKFGNSIRVISQPNGGQASAIRNGLENALGKYAIIVNADDPLMGGTLFTKALEAFTQNAECVVVYPDWQIIDLQNKVIKKKVTKEYSREELVGNFNCLVGPGGIFKTDLAKKIGGWNSEFKYVPDYDFWLRMSNLGTFERLPGVMAQWRNHDSSISIGSRGMKMGLERIKVMENYLINYPQPQKLANAGLSAAYFTAAQLTFFDASIPGREWLYQAIKKNWKILFMRSPAKTVYLLLLPVSSFFTKIIRNLFVKS